ncbi:hypothetical protein AN219_14620, partial [Streptomyces nanshensis]
GLLDAAAGTAGSLLRAFPAKVGAHLAAPCTVCAAGFGMPDGPPASTRLTVPVPEVPDTPQPAPGQPAGAARRP